MTNEIDVNSAQILLLENQIRLSSSSTFNAQNAYENTFEDVLSEFSIKQEEEKQNKINFANLGMPAGFILDTSLLNEEDKIEVSSANFAY